MGRLFKNKIIAQHKNFLYDMIPLQFEMNISKLLGTLMNFSEVLQQLSTSVEFKIIVFGVCISMHNNQLSLKQ